VEPAQTLARFLEPRAGSGGLLVVTGAGVSLASGIPTFRGSDPGAVWKQDVTELGTWAYFTVDPVGSWRWYLSRFDSVLRAEPNAAHEAIALLERRHAAAGVAFLLATQNVDTLHERAGSTEVVKVHGSADRIRCTRPGCRHAGPSGSLPRDNRRLLDFLAAPSEERLPRCPECASLLRQHVLWFDETYDSHDDYQFRRVLRAADVAARILFVGTSFSVGITDAILRSARFGGAVVLSIDPGGHPAPPGVRTLAAPAEEILPAALRIVGA
jgi:NAD-dependent deacetylase